jgi:hydrogenase-4 component F
MEIILLILIPFITAILCLLPKNEKQFAPIQISGSLCLLLVVIKLLNNVIKLGVIKSFNNLVYIDAFSGLLILIIGTVSLLVSLYSADYMIKSNEEYSFPLWKLKKFYFLLNIFVLTMLTVVISNNIGLVWVGIEVITLISAFLVGYYNKSTSIEAAWKYIILCSVGIAFAMIGIILCFYAAIHSGGVESLSLNWDYLLSISKKFNPNIIKLAFAFILIGYGTKVGLAPMHSWLPDAYSEAPTPVSALLSGVLLKCSLYSIIRFTIIANESIGAAFTNNMLLFFGMFSIALSVPFIMTQNQIKRLLAYSSLEHIGIIVTGLGIGSPLSIFGAVFHMFNHAITKTLMFFTAGNLSLKFQTKDISKIKSAINIMPFSGTIFLIGALALMGSPPFSVFLSEFYIIRAGILEKHWVISSLFILFSLIIFGAIMYQTMNMTIGNSTEEKNNLREEVSKLGVLALVIPLFIITLLSVWIPAPLFKLLNRSVEIIHGKGIL